MTYIDTLFFQSQMQCIVFCFSVNGLILLLIKTKAYELDYAEEMTTHYESATYKFILGAIERDNYPKFAFDGWC